MPLTYTYADAYLKGNVTPDREARALSDVDAIMVFADLWRDRLAVLRAYVITCLACQAGPDDLFAQKLKHYRAEFDTILAQARADTTDTSGHPLPALSIPLE